MALDGERKQGSTTLVESADAGDVKTPGKQSLPENPTDGVIPMTGKATVTHETDQQAPSGAANTRKTVAIGELVYFSSDAEKGTWSADVGSGKKAKGGGWDWRAPSAPGSATITFDPGGGTAPTTVTMRVIGPDSITYSDKVEDKFTSGTAAAGMKVKLTFLPLSVNFWGTQWRETVVDASSVSGWFEGKTKKHAPAAPRDIGSDNAGPGDHISYSATGPFKEKGSFTWDIPQQVSVKGANDWQPITNYAQVTDIEPDGTLSISKNGESVTRSPK